MALNILGTVKVCLNQRTGEDESVANPRYIDKQLTLVFMTKISPSTRGGGNSNIFSCSLLLGLMFQFDEYFSDGLKPPTSHCLGL